MIQHTYRFMAATLLLLLFSCGPQESKEPQSHSEAADSQHVVVADFQKILDDARWEGSITLFSTKERKFYSNDFEHAQTLFLPASTYKIPHSLIAIETGVMTDDSTMIRWDGEERGVSDWNQDLFFRDAFHYSCVPCYRQIAREVGVKNMNAYLDVLDYGNKHIDSTDLDIFWLRGDFAISPMQQIDFLKRYARSQLPISNWTEKIGKRMMVVEANEDYKLIAKSGRSSTDIGWYVGWMETANDTLVFATCIEPLESFEPNARKSISMEALGYFRSKESNRSTTD